jgi:hypothetical protein
MAPASEVPDQRQLAFDATPRFTCSARELAEYVHVHRISAFKRKVSMELIGA